MSALSRAVYRIENPILSKIPRDYSFGALKNLQEHEVSDRNLRKEDENLSKKQGIMNLKERSMKNRIHFLKWTCFIHSTIR